MLAPQLKLMPDSWTSEEDERLLECVASMGHRWNVVAQNMAPRTDSQCWRRYQAMTMMMMMMMSLLECGRTEHGAAHAQPVLARLPGDSDEDDDDDDDDDDDQKIRLEELLDGLALDAGPDPEPMIAAEEGEVDFVEGERAKKDGITYVARDAARLVRDRDTAVPVANGVLGEEYNYDPTPTSNKK